MCVPQHLILIVNVESFMLKRRVRAVRVTTLAAFSLVFGQFGERSVEVSIFWATARDSCVVWHTLQASWPACQCKPLLPQQPLGGGTDSLRAQLSLSVVLRTSAASISLPLSTIASSRNRYPWVGSEESESLRATCILFLPAAALFAHKSCGLRVWESAHSTWRVIISRFTSNLWQATLIAGHFKRCWWQHLP